MGTGRAPSEIQAALVALASRVHQVDIRAYESMPPDRLVRELHPIATELLIEAGALVVSMVEDFGEEAPPDVPEDGALASPYLPFESAVDTAIQSQSQTSHRALSDIAFIARLELRERRERLERVATSGTALAIVGECDSALRRIRKTLSSLDRALAKARLVESPKLDFATELELSLQVRQACHRLRTRILAGGEPTPETLRVRLRGAGTTIAMLVGWEVYAHLRVRDRLQLRDLQRRVLDWLRSDRDPVEGMRLWQDLGGFVRMLAQVSSRQELVEHDTRVVREARGRLSATEDDGVPEAVRADLARLTGLDDELDAVLGIQGGPRASALLPHLERLSRQMRHGGPA